MMNTGYIHRASTLIILLPSILPAQLLKEHEVPLKNWAAPPYWQPSRPADETGAPVLPDASLNPLVTLPTSTLVFVGMTPCRVIDTRVPSFGSTFGPPSLQALATRNFPIQSSTLCSVPSTALAYSFNITVTPITTPGVNPPGYLGFLTVYPTGAALPNASTLNNYLGTVVSNAAIVPAGDSNGSVSFYPHDATDVIVDINGYYIQGSGGSGGGATVSVGTTMTGAPGTAANVTNSGTSSAAILNFTIPQGLPGTGGSSQWATNGSSIYYNSGNVGIGTTTPGQKLEVNGNLMVDGNINFGGTIYSGSSGVPVFQAPNDSSYNFGAGYGALQSVTPITNGQLAANGSNNTAIGNGALASNTTGGLNAATGYQALYNNTVGGINTASGARALYSNTTGSGNTANGFYALFFNNTGGGNVANGSLALTQNTLGDNNTACGSGGLGSNTTGSYNTAVGSNALSQNTTGTRNIGIGWDGGFFPVTGSYNIMVGNEGLAADDRVIRIGDVQTKTFIAGISGVNVSGVSVLVSSSGQLGVASSSRRFKQDIEDMGTATDNLMRLRPVTYRYKQPFEDGSQPIQYGLIAEEVEEVYPELVAHSADGKTETVKYQVLDSMLLNEVQKQNATITAQKEKIHSLEERLSRLESLLEGTAERDGLPR